MLYNFLFYKTYLITNICIFYPIYQFITHFLNNNRFFIQNYGMYIERAIICTICVQFISENHLFAGDLVLFFLLDKISRNILMAISYCNWID